MLRSYLRQLTDGPIAQQLRRFTIVGAVSAAVQMGLLWMFVDTVRLNYLLGAAIAIEITIILNYVLNNAWTFRHIRNTGSSAFITGLLKTNIVRGSAIPIQLVILFLLVEYGQVLYLLSNGIAILLSGIYRFILDVRWTWGLT